MQTDQKYFRNQIHYRDCQYKNDSESVLYVNLRDWYFMSARNEILKQYPRNTRGDWRTNILIL